MEYYSVFDDVLAMDVNAGVGHASFLLVALVLMLGVAAMIVLAGQISYLFDAPQAAVYELDGVGSTSTGERTAA